MCDSNSPARYGSSQSVTKLQTAIVRHVWKQAGHATGPLVQDGRRSRAGDVANAFEIFGIKAIGRDDETARRESAREQSRQRYATFSSIERSIFTQENRRLRRNSQPPFGATCKGATRPRERMRRDGSCARAARSSAALVYGERDVVLKVWNRKIQTGNFCSVFSGPRNLASQRCAASCDEMTQTNLCASRAITGKAARRGSGMRNPRSSRRGKRNRLAQRDAELRESV
jgi:hypothetical protein